MLTANSKSLAAETNYLRATLIPTVLPAALKDRIKSSLPANKVASWMSKGDRTLSSSVKEIEANSDASSETREIRESRGPRAVIQVPKDRIVPASDSCIKERTRSRMNAFTPVLSGFAGGN